MAENVSFYSGYLPTIGLYQGKMGAALSLALYAQAAKDELMNEQVLWLFEQVVEGIDSRLPLSMEEGVVGIAYGVTLLYSIGAIAGDLVGALIDIDQRIMEFDPRRMTDGSFRKGLGGIASYLELRSKFDPCLSTFDATYLTEMRQGCQEAGSRLEKLSPKQLLNALAAPDFEQSDFAGRPITLEAGSSYYLLHEYHALLPF